SYMEIDPSRATALSETPVFARLQALTLNCTDMTPASAEALFAAPLLRLAALDLDRNQIGPKGVRALLAACPANQLTVLDLDENKIKDEGAQHLATVGSFDRLQSLNLSSNELTKAGAQALAQIRWPALSQLGLSFNRLRDRGIRALAGSADPPRLTSLDLNY